MKKNYLAIAASILIGLLASSCNIFTVELDRPINDLSELQVDNSYIAIPAQGGSQSLSITADGSWEFDNSIPDWLTITPASGSGDCTVAISAGPAVNTRSATLKIKVADKTQYVNVKQQVGDGMVSISTCQDVISGPDGKIYQVVGTVTRIAESATYGNWYLDDGTGEIYIYGTKYEGQTKQGAIGKLGIEVGDVVLIEGPKTTYNGTVELVDVDVLDITKSLVKLDGDVITAPKEGGEFEVHVSSKGESLDIVPSEDWIHISNISKQGINSIITLAIHANEGDARTGTVSVSSSTGSASSNAVITVTQASGLAAYKLPYEETFEASLGAWEINNIDVEKTKSGLVWAYASGYGAKAGSGQKCVSESDLVSPNIDLTGVSSAFLTFDHVQRYAGDVNEELTLWASTDNGTTWKQVLIPAYSTGKDWNFIPSGAISLKPFVGNLVKIAFKYKSNDSAYATWEIKNVKVTEGDGDLASVAAINDFAVSAETAFTATLKDATVSYVNGGNAFIQDATGGIQLYKSGHGLTEGQVINGTVTGKVKLYNGYAELTDLNLSGATLTDGEVPEGVTLTVDKLLKTYLRYQNVKVKLADVTLNPALTTSNRNSVAYQGEAQINVYSQVKNSIEIAADVKGALICWPTRYNATLQVGVWNSDHFTPAN